MHAPVLIFGLTASGKTSQAQCLSKGLSISYLSGSARLLSKLGRCDSDKDYVWLGSSGEKIESLRDQSDVDRETDDLLLAEAHRLGTFVSDSWTLPWLFTESAIRIRLRPSLQSRCSMARASKDAPKGDFKNIEAEIEHKDTKSRERFLRIYGFDIFKVEHFDISIDNGPLEPKQTHDILQQYVLFRWSVAA